MTERVSVRYASIPDQSLLTDGKDKSYKSTGPGRPSSPHPLRRGGIATTFGLVTDLVLAMFAVLFLALGIAVRSHNEEPVLDHVMLVHVLAEASRYVCGF